MSVQHLWEVKHPYYCNKGNFYARESVASEYGTFAEFMAEQGTSDFDLNLLFRWDWEQSGDDDGEPLPFQGDNYYRDGTLLLFWMGQRKGLYRYSRVAVCRADEPAVIAFLQPRLDYLASLWAPLTIGAAP